MKRTLLALLAMIITLLFIGIFATFFEFILGKFAAAYDYKIREAHFTIDIWALIANLVVLGIPYLFYLIIFKIIIKKKISLKVREICTALIACSLYVIAINTLAISRPDMLELYVLIPLSAFFICGFSLPFVDEFFIKKLGSKKSE